MKSDVLLDRENKVEQDNNINKEAYRISRSYSVFSDTYGYSYFNSLNNSNINLSRDRSSKLFNGFSLRFENLIIWIPQRKIWRKIIPEKDILKGITSNIGKGSMTAIIGPSGSGKTTMMNFLAGRQNESQMFLSHCDYYINGAKIDNVNRFKNIIGYVLQDDIMDVTLTPRQLFTHYAKLRGMTDIEEKVQDVINLMCLESCADTIVGDAFKRGISGGECKRTSIGIEIISDPSLLFLDEPTTGLDSTTALEIMENLADLKSRGITVISTIHSPSKEILNLFDQLIILVEGKLVFDGPPDKLTHRLKKLEFDVPEYIEPIEYFMKIIDKDDLLIQFEKEERNKGPNNEILEKEYAKRIKTLVKAQAMITIRASIKRPSEQAGIKDLIELSSKRNRKLNVFSQFFILLGNLTKVLFKDVLAVLSKSLLFWILSGVLILVYLDIGIIEDETINSIQNRAGFVFILSIIYFFAGTNLSSTMFIPRKQIYLKDKQSRMYDDGPFFLANQLYTLPFFLLNITASFVLIFYVIGLNNDDKFNIIWYWLYGFLGAFIGGSGFGMVLGILAERIEDLGALIPIIVLPQLVVVGYFASVESMTWPLYIFSFASPVRYVFQGTILTEFSNRDKYVESCNMIMKDDEGNEIVMPVPQNQTARCDPWKVYEFQQDSQLLNLIIALSINLGVRILAFILFKIKYRERNARLKNDPAKIEQYRLDIDKFEQKELLRQKNKKLEQTDSTPGEDGNKKDSKN